MARAVGMTKKPANREGLEMMAAVQMQVKMWYHGMELFQPAAALGHACVMCEPLARIRDKNGRLCRDMQVAPSSTERRLRAQLESPRTQT